MSIIRTVGVCRAIGADQPHSGCDGCPIASLVVRINPLIASLLRGYLHEIDIDIKLCWKYTTYVQMQDYSACGFGVSSLISITHLCKVSRLVLGADPNNCRS